MDEMESSSEVARHSFCPRIIPILVLIHFNRLTTMSLLTGNLSYLITANVEVKNSLGIQVLIAICRRAGKRLRTHPDKDKTAGRRTVDKVPLEWCCGCNGLCVLEEVCDASDGDVGERLVLVHRLCPDVGTEVLRNRRLCQRHRRKSTPSLQATKGEFLLDGAPQFGGVLMLWLELESVLAPIPISAGLPSQGGIDCVWPLQNEELKERERAQDASPL